MPSGAFAMLVASRFAKAVLDDRLPARGWSMVPVPSMMPAIPVRTCKMARGSEEAF